jgi:predicted RNase H-like HicB family nuclease
MFADYLRAAMRRAEFKILPEDQSFYGSIPVFRGVYANADKLEACREQLEGVLEGWLLLRISKGLPIPVLDDIDLNAVGKVA